MQVGAVALEELVRFDGQEDIEIARRPAAHTRFAFAGKPDARAILHARRNIDRERALPCHAARTGTVRARILDHLAAALAGRAGALEREESLGMADPPLTTTRRTGARPGAGLGTAARAGLADDGRRDADLRGLAAKGLLEGDLHVVAQVCSALASGTAAAPAAHPEQIVEDVGKRGGKVGTEAAAAAMLEGRMAETIVGGALIAVLEHVVGLVDLLETMLAILVAWIAIRVVLHGELAERGLELGLGLPACHAQDLVVVALAHDQRVPSCSAAVCSVM